MSTFPCSSSARTFALLVMLTSFTCSPAAVKNPRWYAIQTPTLLTAGTTPMVRSGFPDDPADAVEEPHPAAAASTALPATTPASIRAFRSFPDVHDMSRQLSSRRVVATISPAGILGCSLGSTSGIGMLRIYFPGQ